MYPKFHILQYVFYLLHRCIVLSGKTRRLGIGLQMGFKKLPVPFKGKYLSSVCKGAFLLKKRPLGFKGKTDICNYLIFQLITKRVFFSIRHLLEISPSTNDALYIIRRTYMIKILEFFSEILGITISQHTCNFRNIKLLGS